MVSRKFGTFPPARTELCTQLSGGCFAAGGRTGPGSGTERSAGSGPALPGGTPSPDPALTREARRAAADVALGPVVAEGRRQPRDEPVVGGPGALHAEAAGEAGAAEALGDVLLAAGARVPCGDTGTRSGCDTVGSNPPAGRDTSR